MASGNGEEREQRETVQIPNTPAARRRRIVEILAVEHIRSQGQLEALLAKDGLEVTQATLSRDLDDLGAVKVRDVEGALVYAVPAADGKGNAAGESTKGQRQKLARLCEELLISAKSSGNLVVVKTPSGAAQFFASAIDNAQLTEVLGTVAGDDTIFLVSSALDGGASLAKYLKSLAEGTV